MTSQATDASGGGRAGIIVFGHGSRDPLWRLPLEAVADSIRQRSGGTAVSCAYLELCEPSLPQAATDLLAAGAHSLCIFPLFFGVGKHAREDLPVLVDTLRSAHPDIPVTLLPAAGEHAEVIALLGKLAVDGASNGAKNGAKATESP